MPRLETTRLLTARDVMDTAQSDIEALVQMGYRREDILSIFHENGVTIPVNTFNAYFRKIVKAMKPAPARAEAEKLLRLADANVNETLHASNVLNEDSSVAESAS